MGQALFALGHGGLMHDAADAYYAMDIEEQVDIKQLIADAGLNPDPRGDDGLQLPELGMSCLVLFPPPPPFPGEPR